MKETEVQKQVREQVEKANEELQRLRDTRDMLQSLLGYHMKVIGALLKDLCPYGKLQDGEIAVDVVAQEARQILWDLGTSNEMNLKAEIKITKILREFVTEEEEDEWCEDGEPGLDAFQTIMDAITSLKAEVDIYKAEAEEAKRARETFKNALGVPKRFTRAKKTKKGEA